MDPLLIDKTMNFLTNYGIFISFLGYGIAFLVFIFIAIKLKNKFGNGSFGTAIWNMAKANPEMLDRMISPQAREKEEIVKIFQKYPKIVKTEKIDNLTNILTFIDDKNHEHRYTLKLSQEKNKKILSLKNA